MNTNADTDLIPIPTNNNYYHNDVIHLRLHNKDFILVTQASILVILTAIERKTPYGLRVYSHSIPQCIHTTTTATKATTNKLSKVHIQIRNKDCAQAV